MWKRINNKKSLLTSVAHRRGMQPTSLLHDGIVVIVNKDDVKENRDVLRPNDVVNVVDTVCWPIYIPHR